MSTHQEIVADNYRSVMSRANDAAIASGRSPSAITVVAVTKYVTAELIRPLLAAGCRDLGESRPQQLWSKSEELSDNFALRWHMIGHLQRNKVGRTVKCASLIHSVDSLRLLTAIDDQVSHPERQDVLLEVNVSGDKSKHGFAPSAMSSVLPRLAELGNLRVVGLMAMATLQGGTDVARTNFQMLRELRDELQTNCPDGVSLTELSMGMSGDFEAAIAEGATIVRVGSALFEGCDA